MPKTRQQKEQAITEATQYVADAKSMIFVGYHGLSVAQVQELRKKLKQEQVEFQVIKKTLINRVLSEAKLAIDVKNLGTGLAVAFGLSDEVSAAKILAEFKKKNDSLKLYGGVLESKFIDEAGVVALSKLLSKPELYAKLVGSINAPISGFVNVLAGNLRGFMNVLNGIKDAKA
ncbi:50S ribosomal protein L10 [bacterium CG10_46_32]|nr:MAG: 50S ribosomal protein L10 [bacterium CG10_46_32]PIR55672.1 MAG: 50S ribosomal protein L10 [Parcubacteria group bacterium CG10_big_fil_rev_8_21_14_0_10_46_32]